MQCFTDNSKMYLIDIKTENSKHTIFENRFMGFITGMEPYKTFIEDKKDKFENSLQTEKINAYLEYRLFYNDNSMPIIYRVMLFLLKTRLDFDIKLYYKNSSFVNIIQYNLCCAWANKDGIYNNSDKELKDKINYSKEFIGELVTILYLPELFVSTTKQFERKEEFRKTTELIFVLLVNELIDLYNKSKIYIPTLLPIEKLASDNTIYEIQDRLLEKHYKQETTNEFVEVFKKLEEREAKLTKTKEVEEIKTIEETKEIDETEEYYNTLATTLKKYIDRGTPENYKSIVDFKGFNGKENKYLSSKKITLKEWVLFAKTFELNRKELLNLVKFKEELNSLTKNNNYFNTQEINLFHKQATPFEQALIEVRNECLYKIDPTRFPLYVLK